MFWLLVTSAFAAPCCSGASAQEQLLAGEEQARLSLSFGQTVDALSSRTSQMILGGAALVSDRFQVAGSVPIVSQFYAWDSAPRVGLGDLVFGANFEVLPEYAYSTWKPRGFLISRVRLPTGLYEVSGHRLGAGNTGVSLGAVFLKTWADLEASLGGDIEWRTGLNPWKGTASISVGALITNIVRLGVFGRRAESWEIGVSAGVALGEWAVAVSAKEAFGIERVWGLQLGRGWPR